MKIRATKQTSAFAEWTNRALILSLIGIAFLTLFPFRFTISPRHSAQPSVLLLRMSPKNTSPIDAFLNMLLFVPFGFGMTLRRRSRGGSRWTSFLVALAAGATVSYTVEVLQLFVPARDSSWDDVLFNASGSVAGAVLFELCGKFLVELASKSEDTLERWLSPLRTVLLLALYFGIWFVISIVLQQQTRLSNWDPQCSLIVGNDASGQNPWKGRVNRLEIWNRALPERQIARTVELDRAEAEDAGLLVSYDFTGSPPFKDQRNLLPALEWTAILPAFQNDPQPELDGRFRLSTRIPVGDLTRAIQRTSQFTVRIICAPAEVRGAGGRIVSLSQSAENSNFHLRQEDKKIVLWIRNPLSETRATLVWHVDGVFEAGKTRDIVASYDGSDAFLYVDGERAPQMYRLGPGASLMHYFYSVNIGDLEGYVVMHEILVFLPAGLLIGIAGRRWFRLGISDRWIVGVLLFFPPVLLELLLVWVSGRRVWAGNIAFSVLFTIAGALLINSDPRLRRSS